MYGDQAGLPVHGDGPVVAALADGWRSSTGTGKVRLWNPAAEQVTGLSAADVLNATLPFPIPALGQALDHRLPDGRWLKITAGELTGTVDSVVVTFRDISDQHRREGDRDLFVAVTSHELRTPVTVIKGYADTLEQPLGRARRVRAPARRRRDRPARRRAGPAGRPAALRRRRGRPGRPDRRPHPSTSSRRCGLAERRPAHRRCAAGCWSGCRSTCRRPSATGHGLATVLTELVTNADKYIVDGSPIELTRAQ